MYRIFTMRKTCLACGSTFTISSAASKFCKQLECIRQRRRDDRKARKLVAANRLKAAT